MFYFTLIGWVCKDVNGGYEEAYNNWADCYERGEGIRQDLEISYELYKKVVELN